MKNGISIGADLRAYRKKNGFTKEDLASKLGVCSRSIDRWETDKVIPKSVYMLRQIKKLK